MTMTREAETNNAFQCGHQPPSSPPPEPFHLNILEQCNVSPPPDSAIPPISLPLTFLDIPWLLYPPNHTLFFFPKPPPKSATLLKQSLSATLYHFYPLAGNLSTPTTPPAEPHLVYTKGDSVRLTLAKSNANINLFSGNHPRPVNYLYSLVPQLPIPSMSRDTHVIPLLAIQVTFFLDSGFSIGLTCQHAAADERTLDQFLKCWASVCKSLLKKDPFSGFKSTPWFDRCVIPDQNSLKNTFLKQWWNRLINSSPNQECYSKKLLAELVDDDHDMVISTFVLSLSYINMIKNHILVKCATINEDPPVHLSPYVSACSFIWTCLVKVQDLDHHDDLKGTPMYLGFNAGGITRLGQEIPSNYFGNCIAFGRCKAFKGELFGENGVVYAAKAIGKEIKRLDMDVLGGGERWICEWDELNIRVLGSPKVDSYGMDFGWGKVDKVEKISRDKNGGVNNNSISLSGSRDLKGGIEIGVVLSKAKMRAFTSLFNVGLKELAT